jgi:hypothetical protein
MSGAYHSFQDKHIKNRFKCLGCWVNHKPQAIPSFTRNGWDRHVFWSLLHKKWCSWAVLCWVLVALLRCLHALCPSAGIHKVRQGRKDLLLSQRHSKRHFRQHTVVFAWSWYPMKESAVSAGGMVCSFNSPENYKLQYFNGINPPIQSPCKELQYRVIRACEMSPCCPRLAWQTSRPE